MGHVGHSMNRNEGDLLFQRPAHKTLGAWQAPLMARLETRVRVPKVQMDLWVPLIVPGTVTPWKKELYLSPVYKNFAHDILRCLKVT